MTVTAITLTITMTALNTAAIEYTMGNTFAVRLAGDKIMYGVDDNNEVGTMAVVMVVIRPVEQQKSVVGILLHSYVPEVTLADERSINHCHRTSLSIFTCY